MNAPKKRMDFSRYPRRALPTYENLFVEDEESRELYVLLSGCLGIFRDEVKVAEIADPLSIVGEISALTGVPRVATVRALEPSHLVVVDDPDSLFEEYPQLAGKLARVLAVRLSHMTTRFSELKGMISRADSLADVFPQLAGEDTESIPNRVAVEEPVPIEAETPTEKLPTLVPPPAMNAETSAVAPAAVEGEAREASAPPPPPPRLKAGDVSDEMLSALQEILDLDPSVVAGC